MHHEMKSRERMTISLLLVAAVASLANFGGVLATPLAAPTSMTQTPGDSKRSIQWDGLERTYLLHIPTGYDGSTPLPLVFVLHGAGGSGKSMENLTGMSAKADAEKFIVVYPNAAGNPQIWNPKIRPNPFSTADDVGFIRALLNKLEHDLKVDHKRVYCCGFSSGAMMTYRLGAEMSERFAAIGVAAGSIGTRQPDGTVYEISTPAHVLPVIAFHGKKDQTVYYDGNGLFMGQPTYTFSVADSIAFWVKADVCAKPGHSVPTSDTNLSVEDYDKCKAGSEVILYTFKNGTHEWPTLQNNDHFSATDAVWAFFVNHPKP